MNKIVVDSKFLDEIRNVMSLDGRITTRIYQVDNKLKESKVDFLLLDYNDMKVLEKYDFQKIFNDILEITTFRLFGDENIKSKIEIEKLTDKIERYKNGKWYHYTHKLVIKKI